MGGGDWGFGGGEGLRGCCGEMEPNCRAVFPLVFNLP